MRGVLLAAVVALVLSSPYAPAASAPLAHPPHAMPQLMADLALPQPGAPACASGPDDHAFRVLYALPPATVDYYQARLATVRAGITFAQGLVLESSLPYAVDVRLKFFCDAEGEVEVTKVRTPTRSQLASFSTVVRDLRALGYDRPNEKYWVVYEGFVRCGGCFGEAQGWFDDRPTADNANNVGDMFAVTYVGNMGPQGHGAPLTHVMLHEATHIMGGVQLSAPHASGGYHCSDGADVMCYSDMAEGPEYDPLVCPRFVVTRAGPELPYDCNHDDYFHPSPPAGSYLATHWNLGSPVNRFVTWTALRQAG